MSNHEKSQNLTVEQLNAIDLLIQGLSDREVAEKVNVARETITRWRNGNHYFQAELNRKRQEIWGAAEDRLRSLATKAVNVLEAELNNGNFRAAVEVLKAVGLYGNIAKPDAETDPDIIRLEHAKAWARKEIEKSQKDEINSLLSKSEKVAQLVKKRLADLVSQSVD